MYLTVTIPEDTKCLLKLGQIVDFNSPFLENKIISDISIPVANKLHIPSDKIFNYLKKFVGDAIDSGEVFAEKKSVINNYKVVSDSKGIIKEINHQTGEVTISTSISRSGYIKSYFKGEVVELEKKYLKVKTAEIREFNLKQATSDFGGETIYLKDSTKPIFATQSSNKIMVTESVTSYLQAKAEALGIKGFVTLKNPPQVSNLANALIKIIDDFKMILHLNLPYCLINKQFSKIYFYK
ncbi:hypothetical protein A2954_02980 [Candidatus Roizmanbacteria bacterium RIFCSPLOWO2_01_FULL_37_12]|uniref:Uncharacterized protein n=1 Tax=Candidatus Roizmanbacteria bacterium RIFCSPLOWO2_01_FULL_37_12 TaxID=1802056 RepID=A0A1F7IAF4_9BACT|nr:MAG: hypothetical protein A3D76_04360 [Candidatus Roizmanbacteria bacterium RIFCSPHIGHO2_02_FULL_37_9b]OGK40341.1 MAG: hypothetical protein A2954_02980 [Candidatus Roizmanbacteria bacterium RIFCSPLOWO2_01_FULL_37_12]